MSLYLLDTDTLTLLQHHNTTVLTAVTGARVAGHTVGLTVVSIEEQTDGWLKAIRTAKTPARLAQASRSFAEAVPVWARLPHPPDDRAGDRSVRATRQAETERRPDGFADRGHRSGGRRGGRDAQPARLPAGSQPGRGGLVDTTPDEPITGTELAVLSH